MIEELIKKPKLLFVEGTVDCGFFEKLLALLGNDTIQIVNYKGIDHLKASLKNYQADSKFTNYVLSLGIVADADSEPENRIKSIQGILKAVELPVPQNNLEIADGQPKVMFCIVPNERCPGAMEHLCIESIRDDPMMECIEGFFNCIRNKSAPLFINEDRERSKQRRIDKAKALCYVLTREDPDVNLGNSARRGDWDLNREEFSCLRTIINLLSS